MEKIPDIVHESWHLYLQPLFDDSKMIQLKYHILPTHRFYPAPEDVFKVFAMPINKIKVVMLGQDPYSKGEAIGLAFAVDRKTPIPGSLEVIRKEIIRSKVERDTGTNIDSDKWRELTHWTRQGVFLLNSALTVEWRNPSSHINYWQWFTREIVKIISAGAVVKPVWLMWGAKAKGFIGNINGYWKYRGEFKGVEYNYVLEADHPAAELYPEGRGKFTGCDHFNLCNQILKHKKQNIINW